MGMQKQKFVVVFSVNVGLETCFRFTEADSVSRRYKR